MKAKYKYLTPLNSAKPYERVEVDEKNFIRKLFCKHQYCTLVRREEGDIILITSGDEMVIICPKCGKIKGSFLGKFEGFGYA